VDLIVDRMLPGRDGLALVKTLRGAGCPTPVLFLTALSCVDERVQALGRRPPLHEEPTTLQVADLEELEVDVVKPRVMRRGRR
jgi:two-component system OmpR family response regulator